MKYLLIIFSVFGLFSCTSNQAEKTSPEKEKKFQGQVLIEGDDGVRRPVKMTGSHERTIYDSETRKTSRSGGWIDLDTGGRPGKYLVNKSVKELVGLSKKASAREATLIIDELLVRKESSVPALANFLTDSRPAAFVKNRDYWWYEKKGVSPEIVELRIYAAFALQKKVSTRPQGVILSLTKENMFFATKEGYAVVKEDVAKVWIKWWEQAKNDY
jgi:hypothetical protein